MHIALCKLQILVVLFVATLACTGCEALNLTISDPPNIDRREWTAVADLHSIDEIDAALSKHLSGPLAQRHCETLIAGWGQYDSWYDLIVVKFIWEHWARYYGESHPLDYEPLMKQIQNRIEEKPELSQQVCWYMHWKKGPQTIQQLCRWMEAQVIHGRSVEGDDFPFLLYVTGLTGDNNARTLAVTAEWERLYLSVNFAKLQFLASRPFLKYDDKLGRYVSVDSAVKDFKYVDVQLQHMTPRRTPLPNWIGPVPKKKPESPGVLEGDQLLESLK